MRRTLFAVLPTFAGIALIVLTAASNGPLPSYPAATLPASPSTFVVYGDTQHTLGLEFWRREHDAERRLVAEAVAAEAPDFIVNCGDVVSYGADTAEWRRFHEDSRAVRSRRIPYFPALGNHDYYGDNGQALGNFFGYFPQLEGRMWYAIPAGAARIVILNSNFDELSDGQAREQDAWLSRTLAAAEEDPSVLHVVLCFHHPPYTNAALLDDSKEAQDRFLSRRTPKVKVVVSGHVHSYERFVKDGLQFVVSGGGGGPTASVTASRHTDQYAGPCERGFHYLRFDLNGGVLRCDVLMLQPDRTFRRVDGFEISPKS